MGKYQRLIIDDSELTVCFLSQVKSLRQNSLFLKSQFQIHWQKGL
jgi:hypothetical protein